MKMAKASPEEIQATIDLLNEIDRISHDDKYGNLDNDKMALIGELVVRHQRRWSLARIVFGYQMLVDNCCDPAAATIEWRPDIKAAMEKAGIE